MRPEWWAPHPEGDWASIGAPVQPPDPETLVPVSGWLLIAPRPGEVHPPWGWRESRRPQNPRCFKLSVRFSYILICLCIYSHLSCTDKLCTLILILCIFYTVNNRQKDTALAWLIPTNTATHRITLDHSRLNLWGSPSLLSMQGYSTPIMAVEDKTTQNAGNKAEIK